MSERENILARIREGLRVPAPMPGHSSHAPTAPSSEHAKAHFASEHAREWLPRVGPSIKEQFELFQAHSQDLKTAFHLVDTPAQAIQVLQRIQASGAWKRVAAHRGGLTGPCVEALSLPVLWTDTGYDVKELEACDVGITECDALVAQTGSVLITSRSAGGRGLSVLPPHHVVLARRDQLVPDLPAAFQWLQSHYGNQYPSFISLVTGPSRTGDIERILVLGAHGPKELTVICW